MIAYNKGITNNVTNDLYRAQSTNGVLMTIKSWINEYSGEVVDKNIDMQEVKQLYTVRKPIKLMESTDQVKVRLLCLTEGKYTNSPVYRLNVPPSYWYQAMLMIHKANHWGVQRTTEDVRQIFYWDNWRKEVSVFVSDCAGCLHREIIDLKDTIQHENSALFVNQTLCMNLVGPLSLSNNKNKYILTMYI